MQMEEVGLRQVPYFLDIGSALHRAEQISPRERLH